MTTAPTPTSDRVCSACTTCGPTQYQTTDCANGNSMQNRVCASLTNCGTGQYESQPPTSTADRTCGNCVASCGSGFYESQACANGNGASYRICSACDPMCLGRCNGPTAGDCTACPSGQFFNGATCVTLTDCGSNQYQTLAPGPNNDRVCGSCTTCGSGTYESQACANGNSPQNRVCSPVSDCSTGQYQLAAPTPTTDRVCTACTSPCGAGTYESQACANGNGTLDRVCTPLTNCGTGQYMSVAPTATTDRICSGCTTCTTSQYQTQACADGNVAQNRTCAACDASCATCDGAGATHCTSCRTGGSLSNGQCTYTCTLTSAADGYSTNYLSNQSNGHGTSMATTNDGSTYNRSYVRFDVAGGTCAEGGTIPAGSTILSASMQIVRLGGCGTCGTGHDLRRITTSWTEDTIPVGAGPSVSGTQTTTFNAGASGATTSVTGGTMATDVQSFLDSSATNYGWRFTQTSGAANNADPYTWGTRENTTAGNRPRLVVTYR
ncbi:MAG: DNRLRE domain-containing protein [Polyangiales bacterium]